MAKFLLFNFLPIMVTLWPAVFLVIFADLHSQPDIITMVVFITKRKFWRKKLWNGTLWMTTLSILGKCTKQCWKINKIYFLFFFCFAKTKTKLKTNIKEYYFFVFLLKQKQRKNNIKKQKQYETFFENKNNRFHFFRQF